MDSVMSAPVPRTRRALLVAVAILAVTIVVGALGGVAPMATAPTVAAAAQASSGGAPPPVTPNEFIPEDRDLSDCLSALPKPDCGSEARGGWRQGLILALVLLGMIGIAARIVVGVRRRDAALAARADAEAPSNAGERDGPVRR